MRTRSTLALLNLIGGLLGWLWMLASIAAVYFLIAAIAFHQPWSGFVWAIGTGAIANWLAQGFLENQARIAFEAQLVATGYSPEEAGREWMKRYLRT
jgi:hypothetical protein